MCKMIDDRILLQSLQLDGFAVLPQMVDPTTLDAMEREGAALLEEAEARRWHEDDASAAEARGCIFQVLPEVAQAPSNHPARLLHKEYWSLRTSWPYSRNVATFLQSQNVLQLLQVALSSQSVLLYNEQYITKPPCSHKSAFAWHYDSHACTASKGVDYSPYLSLWVALDDMTAENGCLVVLPGSHQYTPAAASTADSASRCSSATARPAWAQQTSQCAIESDRPAHVQRTSAATASTSSCHSKWHEENQLESSNIPGKPPNLAHAANSCSSLALHGSAHSTSLQPDWVKVCMQQPVQYLNINGWFQSLQHSAKSNVAGSMPIPEPSALVPAAGKPGRAEEAQFAKKQQERQTAAADQRRPLALLMPAGSAVLFWDSLLHCSAANSTRYTRTAYMAQFSSQPIVWRQTQQPVGLAVPLH